MVWEWQFHLSCNGSSRFIYLYLLMYAFKNLVFFLPTTADKRNAPVSSLLFSWLMFEWEFFSRLLTIFWLDYFNLSSHEFVNVVSHNWVIINVWLQSSGVVLFCTYFSISSGLFIFSWMWLYKKCSLVESFNGMFVWAFTG